jgi:hypothetical protein
MRVNVENMLRQIGAEVGNRYAYGHMLQTIAKDLLELRDRTQSGDLGALDEFFAIYVFNDGKTYSRFSPETSPDVQRCKHGTVIVTGYVCLKCFREPDSSQETVPAPEASIVKAFERSPRRVQETPAVPPGHFWRGEPESNRHQCRNCGEHYDNHLHTDEASTCPTANRRDEQ